jgi:ADP-heptose:LPS heptosyltransferase
MKYKFNDFETTLYTIDDINKNRPALLEENIRITKSAKPQKFPLIKKLWYNFLALKRTNDNKKLDIKNVKRVLLFRYDALGDYIVSTPILNYLKKNNSNIIIDVVTSYRNDSFISSDKNVNRTYIVHPKNNFAPQTLHSIRKMKKNNYDIIFALVFTKNTRAAELAYMISPSAHKIVFSSQNSKKMYLRIFDSAVTSYKYEEHHCERMFKSTIVYFNHNKTIKDYPVYVPILQKYIDEAVEFVIKNNLHYNPNITNLLGVETAPNIEGKEYVIISLTGFSKCRILDAHTAVKFIKPLTNKYPNIHFYISGDLKYRKLYAEIIKAVKLPNCSHLAINFSTYTAILAGATLLISPDSAPVHIASAAKVPVVGIFVSELKLYEWYPYDTEFTMCWGHFVDKNNHDDMPSINFIDTDKIIEAAEKYLK